MSEHDYEDDCVIYNRPDPRLDGISGPVTITLTASAISIRGQKGQARNWPMGEVLCLEHGILGREAGLPLHGVRCWVRDPEGVAAPGIQIEFTCRNEYFAAVLAKRIGNASGKPVELTILSIPF